MVRDIAESIDRFLDEYRKALPIGELIASIKDLASMLESELSDMDRQAVVDELNDCRAELAHRVAEKTTGTA